MKYNKPHYLDTNIFISISLQDKFKEKCEEYFEKNYKKYTSQKVKKESYNVIKKLFGRKSREVLSLINAIVYITTSLSSPNFFAFFSISLQLPYRLSIW